MLAEDDDALGQGIVAGLEQSGFRVVWVKDGLSVEPALDKHPFQVLVLDISLPGLNGLEVIQNMRAAGNRTPVLFLTAYGSVADRIRGLDLGGDDYMTKPFDLDELIARLRALSRRVGGYDPEVSRRGELLFDSKAMQVSYRDQPVELTPKEYRLLELLLSNPNRAFAKQELDKAINGSGAASDSNSVEVHIHNLRKKTAKSVIRTVRSMGYAIGECL